MVQALSLQHQLSPRAGGGGGRGAPVLLAPLAPASSLTFDTFAAQQHGRVLEATRAQDSYAAIMAAPPAAPTLLPSVHDDPALRAAMVRMPNTRLLLSILQAEAYAQDESQMVRIIL